MLIDRCIPEDVFTRMPEPAGLMVLVFMELGRLLDDDILYQQVRGDLVRPCRLTAVRG